MDLLPVISQNSTFTILLAPPAWGKTSLLLDILERTKETLIFISPLRALADEFYERSKKITTKTLMLKSDTTLEEIQKAKVIVSTPESWEERKLEKVEGIFVIDEFHLFFYWGESFRPHLLEFLYLIGGLEKKVLALSATFDLKLMDFFSLGNGQAYEHLNVINVGNRSFLNRPSRIELSSSKSQLYKKMNNIVLGSTHRYLFFVQYRREVGELVKYFESLGVRSTGCVSGWVPKFREEIKSHGEEIRVIVSTSVLSHGVNLPTFSGVFICYELENKDMWIQMASRAGRKGESFKVYALNDPNRSNWKNKLLKFLRKIF